MHSPYGISSPLELFTRFNQNQDGLVTIKGRPPGVFLPLIDGDHHKSRVVEESEFRLRI